MTASPVHAPSLATEGQEAPFAPGPVEELLRLVIKAGRAHQLYLPNNPIYKGAIDTLRAGFSAIWSQIEEITLTFSETGIHWYDHVVLSEPTTPAAVALRGIARGLRTRSRGLAGRSLGLTPTGR